MAVRVIGAFWGRGKCPVCFRPYQKDLRLIILENVETNKIIEMVKLCSWCLIVLFGKMLRIDPNIRIEWAGTKEEADESDRIQREIKQEESEKEHR